MAREWTLNLENTGGRAHGLKDPVGYKQEILEVVVRSGQSAGTTQLELFEKVSIAALSNIFLSAIESMGLREVTDGPAPHVPLHLLDDRVKSVDLHHHVHRAVRHDAF